MHELGVVIEVVRNVRNVVKQNELSEVESITLQIGQLCSMIPKYVKECYPAAVDGTELEQTELKIEVIPANGLCHQCQQVFNVLEHRSRCPSCDSEKWGLLSGKEFMIKEIAAR
ncbi:hydrogenase maturation nickel metallochaperone HypA [Ferrimonas pelagia]|uniref:Hydrogenase maturation factor HypA n=1 Tax=Ferrimonas pelagia TaxID=1177826 RepID=A0ABP9F0J3_9GAMM